MDRAKQQRAAAQAATNVSSLVSGHGTPGPCIGSELPKISVSREVLHRNRVVAGFEGPATEAFRALRTQVLQAMSARGWSLLGVTSPMNDAGKTLTAINLAMMLAKDPRHDVLLVDLDLRHASVHRYLGCRPELGLIDYLAGTAQLVDVCVDPGIDSLTVLLGSPHKRGGSELLAGERMTELVTEMRRRAPRQWVVFDLPPVLQADDALAFSPFVDACLLVVEANASTRRDIRSALDILQRTELLGVVLNKSREPVRPYY